MITSNEKLRVLLVDDEHLILRCVARILRRSGHEVYTALNYKQAIKIMGEKSFDVVVSDHHMPGPSGVDVLKMARRMRPDALRMMISSDPPEDLLELKRTSVIHHFMFKPGIKKLEELLDLVAWEGAVDMAS